MLEIIAGIITALGGLFGLALIVVACMMLRASWKYLHKQKYLDAVMFTVFAFGPLIGGFLAFWVVTKAIEDWSILHPGAGVS